jgi:hypothetical protein
VAQPDGGGGLPRKCSFGDNDTLTRSQPRNSLFHSAMA